MKILLHRKTAAFIAAVFVLALAERLNNFPLLADVMRITGLAASLAVLLAPGQEEQARRIQLSRLGVAAAALVGAAGSLSGVVGWLHGTPAFAHDWKWPLDALQSHDQLASLSSLWLLWGSGGPAIQALGNYPIVLYDWVLGYILPTHLVLLSLLGVIGAGAGIGVAALAAQCGLKAPYQIVVAATIAAMPPWFNRLNAGHLEWLLGYALFPGALAIVLGSLHPRRAAGALGVLWGLAAGQAQFLLFFPLAALPLAIRARRATAAAAGVVLAIAMQAPAIAAMICASHVNAFAGQRPNLTWQFAQSDPPSLALISAADPAHYFAHWENGTVGILLFGVLILAALGAFRNTTTRMLALIWILSATWSAGLDGPLAPWFGWLFAHVPAAIALREFAHAQAVTAPVLLILVAHGAGRIADAARISARAGAALAFIVLLPISSAAYSGAITRETPPLAASAERDRIVADVAALPGTGQVLWWPGIPPVAYDGTRGGVDGEAFLTGQHAPYAEYRPTAALAQAVVAVARGERAGCGLLGDLGVQAVVMRGRIEIPPGATLSGFADVPPSVAERAGLRMIAHVGSYTLYVVPCYRGRFTFASDGLLYGDWTMVVRVAARLGATDERTRAPQPPAGCVTIPFDRAHFRPTDTAHDWVPLSELDTAFLDFDNAFGDVYVTGDAARYPSTRWSLAAPPNAPYTWMAPGAALRLRPRALGVWQLARCSRRPALHATPAPDVARSRRFVGGAVVFARPTLVVSHYGPAAGWMLRTHGEGGARPVFVDGFASGWLVRPGRWLLALAQVGPPIGLLWGVVVLAGAACLSLMNIRFRR